ncbi:hypothetical protein ABZ478_20035 [Streptomyces sp. NPDC005706]|uniref:hypothetical protein n=1 Tax=Streptomyces sp. NPDC005706 TaxID=3157169 RepID=UPI0033F15DDF
MVNPPRENAHKARYSITFFYHPAPDAAITCSPTYTDADNAPLYPPVRSDFYLADKHRRAYIQVTLKARWEPGGDRAAAGRPREERGPAAVGGSPPAHERGSGSFEGHGVVLGLL